MFLEVIAKNIKDVIDINKTKADRIELCKDLEVGGLTPDYEIIKQAAEISKLPINVIVRPTSRGFVYTKQERKQIFNDIRFIKTTKANGIVFGALNKRNKINTKLLKKVLKKKGNLKITFHKAFDELEDLKFNYILLDRLKIDTVLTAGGRNIDQGIDVIKELIKLNKKTIILIGGGVNLNNISYLSKLSNNIHIGRLARHEGQWIYKINTKLVNKIKASF
ncbi:copper homeostasis protein CutC [Spiroplasma tabanidicola]|uniref:Copper homeostasis protein cutC homolog n=1 Tax=Spiroplasma tabanidicola TaxID=324079 RepID=A0A6I6C7S4_9MOLU|nr:copper homeostasis protein CutC [Spiroplasma tabanidicola]QGS52270.1 copper homeostasis protein [Spiroplasma tabanidicola]